MGYAYHNPDCDGSGPCTREPVRVLPTGGDGNILLCWLCYMRELRYRIERNRELGPDCQFKLPAWENLRIYRQ